MWITAGLFLLLVLPVGALVFLTGFYFWLCKNYMHILFRIFMEKPIFVIPRGNRPDDSEDVDLHTPDGLKLKAGYLKTTAPHRKGVILFGLEFGANRWSCVPYCEHLRAAGYDIFTYEPRNQGESDKDGSYTPLQWVTDRDVIDCRTALEYLKHRSDVDRHGIGLYGISKGGGAGLVVAAEDQFIRCVLTDGAFATYSTVVPYMRYWYSIYDKNYALHGLVMPHYYGLVLKAMFRRAQREHHVHYVSLENAARKISPRPLFMIHGEKDSYIRPSMALALYNCAKEPKDFWLVSGARHNQAIELAQKEYTERVREFFDGYLAHHNKS
jgi:pimeloyl-ACP methyl ester carboxylesterase